MLRGIKRALARRGREPSLLDASKHTDRSGAPSEGTVHLFALDDAAEAAAHQQCAALGALAAGAAATAADPSAHARREALDDSVRQRQDAAAERRAGRLDPMSSAYQVSVLLSLSTFFEHKLQEDAAAAMAALRSADAAAQQQQQLDDEEYPSSDPGDLGSSAASAAASFGGGAARSAASASARCCDVARVALALSQQGYTVIVRRVLHR
jgi:hypothetical protein